MTSHDLHRLAERIAREQRIEHSAALAILGRRGAEAKARRRNYGVTRGERGAFGAVERPAKSYWWQSND